MKAAIFCPYCGKLAQRVGGSHLWPDRRDLSHKWFYRCDPCDAHVGTHEGSGLPLGRLANAELRAAKQAAHRAFDPLWKNWREAYPNVYGNGPIARKAQGAARSRAYWWLSHAMQIPPDECHIAMFDLERARLCVEVIEREQPDARTIRARYKHEPTGEQQ